VRKKTNSLHDRLLQIAGHLTFAQLGGITGSHPETVRRFMRGQTPKPEFLTALCTELGINGDWLLAGRGQVQAARPRVKIPAADTNGEAGAGGRGGRGRGAARGGRGGKKRARR
jgi:transcriptional regulator with XRE-family HTH domain